MRGYQNCYKYRRKQKKPTIIIVSSVILLFVAAIVYIRLVVTPVVKTVAEASVRALTVSTVTGAVSEVLRDEPSFVNMVEYEHDANGDVSDIRVNTSRVNLVVQRSVAQTQSDLTEMKTSGVNIPIGSLSGITFLSGKGPAVNVTVIPVGSVEAKLKSEFIEIGINQTIHKIYLSLDSTVKIIIPGASDVVKSNAEVLLIESIIIGKVPDTYLNATTMEDMMDLIG